VDSGLHLGDCRAMWPLARRRIEIVLLSEPEGGFSVFIPELPSVATQGETIEEAIEAYLKAMQKDGLPNPDRSLQPRRSSRGVSTKLPAVNGKQVIASRKGGLVRQAIRGSHHVLWHPNIPGAMPAPIHSNPSGQDWRPVGRSAGIVVAPTGLGLPPSCLSQVPTRGSGANPRDPCSNGSNRVLGQCGSRPLAGRPGR